MFDHNLTHLQMSDHNLVNNSGGNSNNLPDVAATSGNATSSTSNGDLMSTAAVRDWIETKNKKAALKLEKLDTDLKNYKSNSIKVPLVKIAQKFLSLKDN